MKHIALSILLVTTLVACASAKLTEAGSRVRVTTSTPHNCKYVGSIESHVDGVSWTGLSDMELLKDLRNKAAEKGANTVQMIASDNTTHDSSGEAYFCDYN